MFKTGYEIISDLRLRERAIENKDKTGYPHLDKSHLQYYTMDAIAFGEIPDTSMYGLLLSESIRKYNSIAFEYYGRKILQCEAMVHIYDYFKTFEKIGIKKGEVVSIISQNTPEAFYSIYALNKIGAVINLIDEDSKPNHISYYLSQAKSKRLIMLDTLYPKLKSIIDEQRIKEVYTISLIDSLTLGSNCIQAAKALIEFKRKSLSKAPEDEVYHSLKKTVEASVTEYSEKDIYGELNEQSGRSQELALIVNTTSENGIPERVMFTNENVNYIAYNYKYSGFDYSIDDSFLGVMPFTDFGLSVHVPLILGLKNIIVPDIKKPKFVDLLIKSCPNHVFADSTYYQYLIESKVMKRKDLSFIKNAFSSSQTFDEGKAKINAFLVSHNCQSGLKATYITPAYAGTATSQYYIGESNSENELLTTGIPAIYTNVKIVQPETNEALKCHEVGEIVLSGAGVPKKIEYDGEDSDLVSPWIEKKKKETFLHTGDYGYVDENGCLYIYKRVEGVVLQHNLVEDCVCVNLRDRKNIMKKVPVVFIKIKTGYEDKVEQIISELETMTVTGLSDNDVVLNYIVIDNIPRKNGVIDYDYLKNNYAYDTQMRARTNNN